MQATEKIILAIMVVVRRGSPGKFPDRDYVIENVPTLDALGWAVGMQVKVVVTDNSVPCTVSSVDHSIITYDDKPPVAMRRFVVTQS